MKKFIRIFVVFVAFMFMFSYLNVNAEELNNDSEPQTQMDTETEEVEEGDDFEHRAAVIISKLDENGNFLPGAVLQLLDSEGLVVDEWTSGNDSVTFLLPEGTYTLHEVSAPEGYIKAEDKTIIVEVKGVDLDAGVDYSETPCWHYGGTPLYYVNFEGQKEEVYCINQDWETPDENSNYDGNILNPTDIREYMYQTVKIDAEGNTEKIDVSDQNLTSEELYNKILDIIYHRQLASDLFSDLTEAEIRYITENALKNYTNAGLTRVQGGIYNINNLPEGVTEYWYNSKRGYYQYLYTHFRSFVYLPDAPLGENIYKTVVGEGDAFGTLARHWNDAGTNSNPGHNAKNKQEVRDKIARYYELYQYLISDQNHHPEEMLLYIFSTNNQSPKSSGNNFDDGAYQNLLGVRWANPDENIIEVNLVNKAEIVPPVTGISNNNSNSIQLLILLFSVLGISLSLKKRFN